MYVGKRPQNTGTFDTVSGEDYYYILFIRRRNITGRKSRRGRDIIIILYFIYYRYTLDLLCHDTKKKKNGNYFLKKWSKQ